MLRCSINTAGIETTNGATVIASASSISGTAPPHAQISVFDTGYIPAIDSGLALTTSANDSGCFTFEGLAPDLYTVIVEMPDSGQAALFSNILVGPFIADSAHRKILGPTGSISGTVASADSSAGILLYLPGTGYYRILSNPGPFSFEGIPAGTYRLQACALTGYQHYAVPTIATNRNQIIVEVLSNKETTAGTLGLQ